MANKKSKIHLLFLPLLALTLLPPTLWASKKEINIAISSFPNSLKNPFFATDGNSQNTHRLVHISLIDFDEKMKPICRLCENFKEEIKKDSHEITFQLRKDQSFWDGERIEAKHVEESWGHFTEQEKIKSIFRFAFRKIKNVEILGKYKIKLIYKTFSPDNLSNLTLFKIVKIKEGPFSPDKIIGGGPYRYGKVGKFRYELLPLDKTSPNLVFKTVKDETTLMLKLINNEIDLTLVDFNSRKLNWLKKRKEFKELQIFQVPSSNFKYIGINHKNEHLKLLEVRKALSLLIPRDDIKSFKFHNSITLSTGLLSPSFKSFYKERKLGPYDPSIARELLKKVGYQKNKKGVLEKDGKELKLVWRTSSNPQSLEIIQTIKNYWEKEGIRIIVQSSEWGSFYRAFKKGDYSLVLGQWIGFTGPEIMNELFHKGKFPPKGRNRGFYENPQVDKLLELGIKEPNLEKRSIYYNRIQDQLNEDFSYINLWHPNIVWVGKSCLKDLSPFPNGSFLPLLKARMNCGKR